MNTVAPTLLTIGYEAHREPQSLLDALQGAGVERLVDVRELPLSRRRGFSKTALRDMLSSAGIEYRHDRPLGNPKLARDEWRYGDRAVGERLYREHLHNGSAVAVDALSEALTERRTCVMCFEADHRDCHRDILVEELRRRLPGLRVEHLG